MARLHPRRQLEQWHECRGIHVESEQYADEYQYQHWLSGRQELQVPPEAGYTGFWSQEWRSTMVTASVHDDLPFALSRPERAYWRATPAKYDSWGRIPVFDGLSPLAFRGSWQWIS